MINERPASTVWGRGKSQVRIENKDRSRWYGIRPGDTVTESAFGQVFRGLVVEDLHGMDNNGCNVRDRQGKRRKAVCEWLTVTTKVEDK